VDATPLAAKKKADADFKNAAKLIKAEGGKNQVSKIKIAIRLETDEGEAEVRAELQGTMQVARWVGASIDTQFEMFADAGGSRLFEEGKRSAMRGEACKAPTDATADGQQEFIKGWHAGNEARNANSITSSARASNIGGTVRPSVLAVCRLMTNSYLVGNCTGISAGFSPLRMRPA
jgi:hypothetical protein